VRSVRGVEITRNASFAARLSRQVTPKEHLWQNDMLPNSEAFEQLLHAISD
jgi:hypothetical protein